MSPVEKIKGSLTMEKILSLAFVVISGLGVYIWNDTMADIKEIKLENSESHKQVESLIHKIDTIGFKFEINEKIDSMVVDAMMEDIQDLQRRCNEAGI